MNPRPTASTYIRQLITTILAVTTLSSTALATDTKTITVAGTSDQASLDFSFNPVKPAFDVTEPLEFSLRANQDIFLYVYTVTSNGDYALILPNHMQKQNKYPADTTLRVPNRNVAFMADGTVASEPVYAIASTRYIDLDIAKQRKIGDFAMIGEDDMQKRFGAKGITLRDIPPGESQVQLVTESSTDNESQSGSTLNTETPEATSIIAEASLVRVDVEIENSSPATNTPLVAEPDPVITFVSTDQADYNSGDTVHILFGASEAGKIELYLINPDGSGADTPILTREVDGKGFEKVSATHDGSAGAHTIRAVYIALANSSKNLTLNVDASQESVTSRSVKIMID